ncbi:MAG TPA: hypothetical protein DCZ05_06065 [Deltaproteobacteria bacterium]|nr:hypothetical protein [Deltaproteobacteria bacterium]
MQREGSIGDGGRVGETILKITTYPSCGSDKVKKVRRNWTGSFNGKRYTVPNLQYYECPDCGERVYDRDAMREIEARSPAFEGMHPKRKSA